MTRGPLALASVLSLGLFAVGARGTLAQKGAPSVKVDTKTGKILGLVVTEQEPPQLVRRAIVSLTGDRLDLRRHAVTDDEGRFQFGDLPAGRYSLLASRPSYVSVSYGAAGPGRPGTHIVLADGEAMRDVRLLLQRGAAISGVVRDVEGEPVPEVQVGLARRDPDGEWTRMATLVRTDDRGAYRVFGLAGGEYVVFAQLTPPGLDEFRPLSTLAVDAALRDLRRGSLGEPEPGRGRVSFAPAFYPGVLVASDAMPIGLGPGDERNDLDFALQLVPAATVEGRVVSESANLVVGTRVTMTSHDVLGTRELEATADADGRFRLRDVGPGQYVLTARTPASRGSAVAPGRVHWGTLSVVVTGADVTGLEIALRPGFRILGRVAFDGAAVVRRPDLTRLRITTLRRAGIHSNKFSATSAIPPSAVSPDGRFEIADLPPGDYWISAALPGAQPGTGWRLRSIIVNGDEVLDLPIRLGPASGEILQAAITFSDAHTALSGTLQLPSGQLSQDYFVVAFSTDRSFWWPMSGRVRAARPDNTGTFTFFDLPPGEYCLTAVMDMVPNEWEDRRFLNGLVPTAVKVTLRESEPRSLDLRIRNGRDDS